MDKDRIIAAIEFLKDGQTFKLGDLTLGRTSGGDILVTGWTDYLDLQNLTKRAALTELKETKELFNKLILFSSDLKEFTTDKRIEYHLAYEDSGKAGIGVCYEVGGQLTWIIELDD